VSVFGFDDVADTDLSISTVGPNTEIESTEPTFGKIVLENFSGTLTDSDFVFT
jgi:hypothetical protein